MSLRWKREIANKSAARTSDFHGYRSVALASFEQREPGNSAAAVGVLFHVKFCATGTKLVRDFYDERTAKKPLMNKGNRGIRERGLQRRLSGRPRALRKAASRAMEKTSVEEIGDREVTANDSFTGTEGLVYAALRVWELKHGFDD